MPAFLGGRLGRGKKKGRRNGCCYLQNGSCDFLPLFAYKVANNPAFEEGSSGFNLRAKSPFVSFECCPGILHSRFELRTEELAGSVNKTIIHGQQKKRNTRQRAQKAVVVGWIFPTALGVRCHDDNDCDSERKLCDGS